VNDECVCDANDECDAEYLKSLENSFVGLMGSQARSNRECDDFRGTYSAGRCLIPRNDEEFRIVQQGLCRRKINSNSSFCTTE
jgi:hypothetical protein